MRRIIYSLVGVAMLLSSCKDKEVITYADTQLFELAPPRIQVDSLLFNNSAEITATFVMDGAEIRYTTDGSEVTPEALPYTKPIKVTEPAAFAFRSFHSDYAPSKEIATRLFKVKQDISKAKVTLTPQPDANYKGSGAKGLVDLRKGTMQFRDGNYWMGFQDRRIRILLDFETETTISNIIVSSLKDHGSWIFLPKCISVFADNKEEIGMVSIAEPTAPEPKSISLLDVPVITGAYKSIEVYIDLMETIPQWHQGKGTAPFFFIDEILVE
mgnify:CR=1 FL=1